MKASFFLGALLPCAFAWGSRPEIHEHATEFSQVGINHKDVEHMKESAIGHAKNSRVVAQIPISLEHDIADLEARLAADPTFASLQSALGVKSGAPGTSANREAQKRTAASSVEFDCSSMELATEVGVDFNLFPKPGMPSGAMFSVLCKPAHRCLPCVPLLIKRKLVEFWRENRDDISEPVVKFFTGQMGSLSEGWAADGTIPSKEALLLLLRAEKGSNQYSYKHGLTSTRLYMKKDGSRYVWSPDRVHWMPCTTHVVRGGAYDGEKPIPANRLVIDAIHKFLDGQPEGIAELKADVEKPVPLIDTKVVAEEASLAEKSVSACAKFIDSIQLELGFKFRISNVPPLFVLLTIVADPAHGGNCIRENALKKREARGEDMVMTRRGLRRARTSTASVWKPELPIVTGAAKGSITKEDNIDEVDQK